VTRSISHGILQLIETTGSLNTKIVKNNTSKPGKDRYVTGFFQGLVVIPHPREKQRKDL